MRKVIMKRVRFAKRRRLVGLSQEKLAEQLGVDRTTVIRWERGETEPQPWQRPNLAVALKVSVEELGALLAVGPEDVWRPIMAPFPNAADPADDLSAMRSFRLADRQVGGTHLYNAVTGYLQHTIAPRLFGVNVSVDNDGLFAAAAGLTEMAGWMAHDAGRDDAAEQHFHRALRLASAGNDAQLGAHIFASLSHLSHYRRQPEQAVRLAQSGRERLAVGQSHSGVQSRLFAMEARGCAILREEEHCTERLLLAERALEGEQAEISSPWVSHFDHAALAAEAARCFLALGQLDSAKRWTEQIVALRPADRPRSRAFAQLMLVSVLIAQRKIDEACSVAREVLDATRTVSSYLVLQQLEALGRALLGHRLKPEVAVFLGLLREELAHRRSLQWVPSS
ncbi:hypothetical protein Rhe02_47310 [Rhizocola hellebori]|uniref:HTH cro/C1-type domain-containing protein n=1 Tax=Rhizocola hellebori TaxID=1392758 RepID=A0A8J3QB00_9ACTN|nr:helix-turn-helix transcriptional regulator [Rhizocola hellebori]GIH06664.1 hypothetical protein Rhe02_47310 [Rhizocola hellebori]